MERLLKRREAAEWLNRKESWLRHAERHRLVPFLKVGNLIRYRVSDLEAWLEGCRVPTAKSTVQVNVSGVAVPPHK